MSAHDLLGFDGNAMLGTKDYIVLNILCTKHVLLENKCRNFKLYSLYVFFSSFIIEMFGWVHLRNRTQQFDAAKVAP